MSSKSILRADIRKRLLSSVDDMNTLAQNVDSSFYTIKNQLLNENPKLCQAHYLEAIKSILQLPAGEVIHTVIFSNENHLYD